MPGGGVYIQKSFLVPPVAPSTVSTTSSLTRWDFFHNDHLGSPEVITTATGAPNEHQSYDPWGRRRDAADWVGTTNEQGYTGTSPWAYTGDTSPSGDSGRNLSSNRKPGFTGHEMLDAVGLVHMNARVYDPEIARFLQPDPMIGDPNNPQDYNAWTYVRRHAKITVAFKVGLSSSTRHEMTPFEF
jgi:RHS repeat-associated protein